MIAHTATPPTPRAASPARVMSDSAARDDALELLKAWELARELPPARRALVLLSALRGDAEVEQLSVGERDRRLLELFEAYFGHQWFGLTECTACGATLELAADLRAWTRAEMHSPRLLSEHEGQLLLRLPNTLDIEIAAQSSEPTRRLAELCTRSSEPLSDETVARVQEAILEADPLLNPELEVCCPTCGAVAAFALDISTQLWAYLEARALRLLREVHTLAWAYGWSQADILALSEARRAAYLELVSS